MTLHNVVLFGLLWWLATNVMWAAFFMSAIAELGDRVKKTRSGLRRLTEILGFTYEVNGWDGGIYIDVWGRNYGAIPASRGDVEKFFKEHEERLNAVYKHLGISVVKKVTPPQPEKREIVVEKVVKK